MLANKLSLQELNH